MPSVRTFAAALLLVGLTLGPGSAEAWGAPGHQIVAAIAEERLTPQTRAMMREIVGDIPLHDAEIATWADVHRDSGTRPWHFVNIPFSAGRYDGARDCPRGACAVAAIERGREELLQATSPSRRADALRWLVHLVADLHQPLHAGDGWDRGGNDLRVRIGQRREPTNLHRVWDIDVVQPLLRHGGPLAAARLLASRISPADAEAWASELTPSTWASESSREARAIYAELGITPQTREITRLPPEYAEAEQPRVAAALQRAGVRLAALLNQIARDRRS